RLRSGQTANPAARGVAVPEDAVADVQAVRLGVFFRQLDPGDWSAVLGTQFVDDAPIGFDAPEIPVVPRQTVRPHAGRWNRADDVAGLSLHQEELSRGRHGHPVPAV